MITPPTHFEQPPRVLQLPGLRASICCPPLAPTRLACVNHASLALTIPLAAALLLFSVPSAVTGLRALNGTLDRRGRLGLQTPAARSSDAAFKIANRVAAPLTLGAAFIGIACAAITLALPIGTIGAIVVAAMGAVGVLGLLGAASNLGERVARTVPLPARKPQGAGCCGGCGCGDGGCGSAADSDGRNADIPDLVADATTLR